MKFLLFAAVTMALICSAPAQSPPASPPAAARVHRIGVRQFDFCLAIERRQSPNQPATGTSEITRASEGCAIREETYRKKK